MTWIPPKHDAAAVYVSRYLSDSERSDRRAFSSGARARRWIEKQLSQDLEWEQVDAGAWTASTNRIQCRVERVTLHDPLTLRRRYSDAFDGEYHEE